MWLFAVAAALAQAQAPPPAPAVQSNPLVAPDGLDHVLLWTPNVDRTTSAFAVRLGFQVRPGGSFPDGSANRLVRFSDNSYLELLYFTRPERDLTGEALGDYRFTRRTGGGANSFGLAVDDVDAARTHLAARGFRLAGDDPVSYDPDGDGPRAPLILWRTATFAQPPLASSDLFFIRYSLPAQSPQRAADEVALTRHPNGAIGISAVWLLSANIAVDREMLERMGFRAGPPVRLAHLAASGVRFDMGREAVILLQPDGPGPAAQAVAARGPHVYGVSIAVADLGRAQRIVERGYGTRLTRYPGPMGEAISAPSRDELGLAIEFHQAPPPSPPRR